MSFSPPKKICPNCHKAEVTAAASCSACQTPYFSVIQGNKSSSGKGAVIAVLVAAAVMACGFGANLISSQKRSERIQAISNEIKAANRPRLIEFYATWCGPCQRYGPVLEEFKAKYGENIDFVRLDVDNAEAAALADKFGVSSIPRTVIFDRQGKQVFDQTGAVSADELERTLSVLAR